MSIIIQSNQPAKSLAFKNNSAKNVAFSSTESPILERTPKKDEYEKKGLSKGAKFAILVGTVGLVVLAFNFKNVKKFFAKSQEVVKPEYKPEIKPEANKDGLLGVFEPDVVEPKKLPKKFLDLLEKKEIESFTFKDSGYTVQVRNEDIIWITDLNGNDATHLLSPKCEADLHKIGNFKNTILNIQRKDKKALAQVQELKIKDNEHLYTLDEISKYINNRSYPQRKDAYAEGGTEALYILSDNSNVKVTKFVNGSLERRHQRLDGTIKTSKSCANSTDGIKRIKKLEDSNREIYKYTVHKTDGTTEIWQKCNKEGKLLEPTKSESGNVYSWQKGEENFWNKRILDTKNKGEVRSNQIIQEEKIFD